MKITIDTKEDTHHEIRKVLGLLTDLLNKERVDPRHRSFSEQPQENNSEDTTSMMSMFNSPNREVQEDKLAWTEEPKEVADTAPDFTSFLNLANKQQEEKKDDGEPKIQFF